MLTQEIFNRKGAVKAQLIPEEVLVLLNKGEIETVNLIEWLAVDHIELIKNNFSVIGISDSLTPRLIEKINRQKQLSAMNTIKLTGAALYDYYAGKEDYYLIFQKLSCHISDSIRCYAPYLIALNGDLNIEQKFCQCQKLVADNHFGVREIVWMAFRSETEKYLKESIEILSKWAESKDENIRRFTTEATRPRGVWCKHIEVLKQNPELGLPVLEKLKSDPSKYVQDSVGNWLNDASKTRPDFVAVLCDQWLKESPTKDTEKIVRKAKRTIDK